MKKNVITFGVIAGLIVSGLMAFTTALYYHDGKQHGGMLLGYATMLIAFSMIFVAVKNYRDKFNAGEVSFGKAFMIGLYITLIASTCYVITWLIIYYKFMPDFMDSYSASMLAKAKASHLSPQALSKKIAEIAQMKAMYKNPVFVVVMTYVEIVPVGLVVTLITALILKKKTADAVLATS